MTNAKTTNNINQEQESTEEISCKQFVRKELRVNGNSLIFGDQNFTILFNVFEQYSEPTKRNARKTSKCPILMTYENEPESQGLIRPTGFFESEKGQSCEGFHFALNYDTNPDISNLHRCIRLYRSKLFGISLEEIQSYAPVNKVEEYMRRALEIAKAIREVDKIPILISSLDDHLTADFFEFADTVYEVVSKHSPGHENDPILIKQKNPQKP